MVTYKGNHLEVERLPTIFCISYSALIFSYLLAIIFWYPDLIAYYLILVPLDFISIFLSSFLFDFTYITSTVPLSLQNYNFRIWEFLHLHILYDKKLSNIFIPINLSYTSYLLSIFVVEHRRTVIIDSFVRYLMI